MQLAELDIENEENEELTFEEGVEEEHNRFELCLVGRFLTEKNINVRAMKSKMADLWKPAMGISIKDLKPGIFLFQFYHKEDMNWALDKGPWTFDNALLVLSSIRTGEDPVKIPLFEVEFWVQIYELPVGLMTEAVGKQLGNFFGTFIQYDATNNSRIWREFMRIRIKLDVRKPLKRKKKILKKDRSEVMVHCKYEKLGDFCFVCGLLSHTERFCKKKLESSTSSGGKEWGQWLRAPPRRAMEGGKSKWLREETDSEWGRQDGGTKQGTTNQGFQKNNYSGQSDKSHNYRDGGSKTTQSDSLKERAGNIFNVEKEREGNTFNVQDNGLYGLDSEELYGLNLEERKRQRSEAHGPDMQTRQSFVPNKDSTLSKVDCVESSSNLLATLATQASHQQ